MTTEEPVIHPPRFACRLVEYAASPEEQDGVLGDLEEEFTETARRSGVLSARRWYWREAGRTIWQLAASPLWMRPAATAMVAVTGISLTRAFGSLTSAGASAIVARSSVYWYVPAPLFWGFASAAASLLAGFFLAIITPEFRFRAVSAAVAVIAALGVWLALDQAFGVLLFGPPLAVRHLTIASSAERWISGMLTFGGATLAGALVARALPFRANRPRSNDQADTARAMLSLAALSGALIGATLMARYTVDVRAPLAYTPGVVTLRSQVTTWSAIAAIALPAAYAAWQNGRALSGFVVGLAGGCIAGMMSRAGVMVLLLLSRDPGHVQWANARALGPFGDAMLVVWTLTALSAAIGGLCGRFIVRPLSRIA